MGIIYCTFFFVNGSWPVSQIVKEISPKVFFPQLRLTSFSYVSDDGTLHEDIAPAAVPPLEYGCGFFELQR